MKRFKLICLIALIVVAVITIFQNTQVVETKILWIKLSMPRALLLVVTMLVGLVGGLLLAGRMGKKQPEKKD